MGLCIGFAQIRTLDPRRSLPSAKAGGGDDSLDSCFSASGGSAFGWRGDGRRGSPSPYPSPSLDFARDFARGEGIFFLLLFFLLFFMPFSAYAEEAAELGEIRVDAAAEQEPAEAPSSFVTVIKPAEQKQVFETLTELISTSSAGVTSRSLGGPGQFSTVSIRGSSPEQVSVYLDGIRLNTASSGAFDFSTIPIESIERIEIIRGGGTSQYGSDAIGGVINIITKTAGYKRSIEAFGGGGSFTTIKLGSSYLEKFKKNSVTLSWTHFQSQGDFTFKTSPVNFSGAPLGIGGGETFTRLHNAFISESFLSAWEHKFNDQFKLNFVNDFFFTDRDVPGTEEETTLLYPTNSLSAKERLIRNSNSVILKVDPFFTKPFIFSCGVTNNLDADKFADPTPALGNAIDTMTYNYSLNPFLKWQATFDHGFMNQSATFRYDYRLDYLSDSSPLSNAILTGTKKRSTNSIFAQDEISFLNDKITLLPAARFEETTNFPNDLGFKFGIKIKPISWGTIKSNFERSFRYPSFSELYFPDQGYIRGNPDLKKEEAWNLDAGADVKTKYASFEAAYFRNWVDNSIIFVPISATTIAPVNTFRVDIDGVELTAKVDPIKYVHLQVNYTYLNAHYSSNNNQLPGRPKHEITARMELNYDWAKSSGGTLFGNLDYKSDMTLNPGNTVYLSPTTKIDLGVNIRFAKYYYVTFEAKDITNVQIYDTRGFPLPRRSFFGTFGAKWS